MRIFARFIRARTWRCLLAIARWANMRRPTAAGFHRFHHAALMLTSARRRWRRVALFFWHHAGHADQLVAFVESQQSHALRVAAHFAELAGHADADDLAVLGDHHQLV